MKNPPETPGKNNPGAGKTSGLEFMLFLAKEAGLHGSAVLPTSAIAAMLGISQQSASRKLRELEISGVINRRVVPQGTEVSLTPDGRTLLRERLVEMQHLFSKQKPKKLAGTVLSGLGEGAYYLSQRNYLSQLEEKLGFRPYVGTLNLRVDEAELKKFLEGLQPVFISGFSDGRRTFGSSRCYAVSINGRVAGAVVIPERTTHHAGIAEVIAPLNLRRKFSLRDGSVVLLGAAP